MPMAFSAAALSNSGRGRECLLNPLTAAYCASSSCRCAASRSTIAASSAVCGLQWTGPANPSATSRGSQPTWSRWAWLIATPARSAGGTGNGAQLRRRSSRSPWNMPQSTNIRWPPCSTSSRLPVTVPAAPRNVNHIAGTPFANVAPEPHAIGSGATGPEDPNGVRLHARGLVRVRGRRCRTHRLVGWRRMASPPLLVPGEGRGEGREDVVGPDLGGQSVRVEVVEEVLLDLGEGDATCTSRACCSSRSGTRHEAHRPFVEAHR